MLKWIGITLAALLALAMAAAVTLSLLFDPNDYKDTLAKWVEQQTGRELSIQGDLKLTFFPWLGVTTSGLTLSNAYGFDSVSFATARTINVRVKLLPLLGRRFEIGTVELDGLILNLATDIDGRGNWQDLPGSRSAAGADNGSGSAANSLDNIQAAGLRLSDATIYWRQDVDQVRYVLQDVALVTGLIQPGEPVDLRLDFNLLSVEPQFKLQLEIAGRASIDSAMDAFSGSGLRVDFTLTDSRDKRRASGSLTTALVGSVKQNSITTSRGELNADLMDPPGGLATDLQTTASWPELRINLSDQTLNLPVLTTTVNEIVAEWTVQAENLLDGPRLSGSVNAAAVPWEELLSLAALTLPQGVSAPNLDGVDLSSMFSYQASDGLTLSNTRLTTLGFQATAAANISADGGVKGRINIPEFDTNRLLQAVGTALPANVDASAITRLGVTSNFTVQPDSGDITLDDFNAQLLGANLTGNLQIAGIPGARVYVGTLKAPAFDAAAVAQAFASLLPENLDAQELGPLGIDSRFRYAADSDQLSLDDLSLQSLGLRLTGVLTARPFSNSPTWSGRLAVSSFSPRDLMNRFGQQVPQTADARALSRATVTSDLVINGDGGQFKSLRLNLDDSNIAGDFRVDDYENPRYGFKLAIDKVNVDRYLPPGADGASEQPGEVTRDQVKVPSEALQKLNLDGTVSVGQMQLAGLQFEDVATGVNSGPQGARLEPARAKLYGGVFEGGLSVDTRSRVPAISLKGSATTIQLEPLLVALRGESMISGSGSFQLDLSGRGETIIANVQSAAGDVEFALRDGVVQGFNLGYALCRTYNAQRKLPPPSSNVSRTTRFTLLRGAAQVAQGIATSRNIQATSTFLAVNGRGGLDLADQGLNYDLTAKLSGPIDIDGCDTMDDVIGQSIPLTLRGTISDPKIAPDFGRLLEQTIRRRVEEEIKDKLLERLGLPGPSTPPAGGNGGQATTPR